MAELLQWSRNYPWFDDQVILMAKVKETGGHHKDLNVLSPQKTKSL
jgi:hypothetical protein